MKTVPKRDGALTADEVIERIRPKLEKIPGASMFLQAVQDINVGGRFAGAQYQYTLQADNLNDLVGWAPRLMERMKTIPYAANRLVFFIHSPDALHGVSARSATPHPRLHVNFLAELREMFWEPAA